MGDTSSAAFDALYQAEYAGLVRLAYVLTGSVAEAEELVQEAFLRCHRHWARVADYDKPGAWLRRVVVNLTRSRARRMVVEARTLLRLRARPQRHAELEPQAELLWAAVRRLPPRQAAATALYYGDDLAVAEVAGVMDCAEGTVRSLLHQARARLATLLESELEELR